MKLRNKLIPIFSTVAAVATVMPLALTSCHSGMTDLRSYLSTRDPLVPPIDEFNEYTLAEAYAQSIVKDPEILRNDLSISLQLAMFKVAVSKNIEWNKFVFSIDNLKYDYDKGISFELNVSTNFAIHSESAGLTKGVETITGTYNFTNVKFSIVPVYWWELTFENRAASEQSKAHYSPSEFAEWRVQFDFDHTDKDWQISTKENVSFEGFEKDGTTPKKWSTSKNVKISYLNYTQFFTPASLSQWEASGLGWDGKTKCEPAHERETFNYQTAFINPNKWHSYLFELLDISGVVRKYQNTVHYQQVYDDDGNKDGYNEYYDTNMEPSDKGETPTFTKSLTMVFVPYSLSYYLSIPHAEGRLTALQLLEQFWD